jgi:hypothetical protein
MKIVGCDPEEAPLRNWGNVPSVPELSHMSYRRVRFSLLKLIHQIYG